MKAAHGAIKEKAANLVGAHQTAAGAWLAQPVGCCFGESTRAAFASLPRLTREHCWLSVLTLTC